MTGVTNTPTNLSPEQKALAARRATLQKLLAARTAAQKAYDEAKNQYNGRVGTVNVLLKGSAAGIVTAITRSGTTDTLKVIENKATDDYQQHAYSTIMAGWHSGSNVFLWDVQGIPTGGYSINSISESSGKVFTIVFTGVSSGGFTGSRITTGYVLPNSAQVVDIYNGYVTARDAYNKASLALIAAKKAYSDAANGKPAVDKPTGGSGGKGKTTDTKVFVGQDSDPVSYNVPAVKSMYFRTSENWNEDGTTGLWTTGGSPATASFVTDASKLWASASDNAHKGMFQTYSYWKNNTAPANKQSTDPHLPSWFGNSYQYQKQRYGFQFLYNPSTVTMSYGGTPVADPGLLMSKKDTTPFVIPDNTSSSISFTVMLNRIADYKLLKALGVDEVFANQSTYYGNNLATKDDLLQIKDLGIMYDLEFLLNTLVGFRTYSSLRSRWTSDMGFLMGFPVELHLGKDLRFIGSVGGFELQNTIFGDGMVPLFGWLTITFNRRIEPRNNNAKDGSMTPSYESTLASYTSGLRL